MGLRVECERRDGCAVIKPCGELDVATVRRLREAVVDSIDAGTPDIVVDLAAVTFIDSSGLGALVGAMKRSVNAGGRLVVTGIDAPGVATAFRASGVGRIVTAERSPDRALAALRG